VERRAGPVKPRVVAIVGAKNTYEAAPDVVLAHCGGRPLIDYTVESALDAAIFDHVFITTDDPAVVGYCRRWPAALAELRPPELSLPHVRLSQVVHHATCRLEREHDIYPDIVVQLSVHTPLRRAEHIRDALDTLLAYDCDSVVSVYEDHELHFVHAADGLAPLNPGMIQQLQLEREALYVDNMAIHALWRDVVTEHDLYGRTVGHIVMTSDESLQTRSALELRIVDLVMRQSAGVASGDRVS
jgi:CMP-N-acetylneuraminic acid synthetase